MSVDDELHWAAGHIQRLQEAGAAAPPGVNYEHTLGALRHLHVALEELLARLNGEGT
jgi:hypothetical protein